MSEAVRPACEAQEAIVGQRLDGDLQAIDQPEVMLDGSEHQIMKVLFDVTRGVVARKLMASANHSNRARRRTARSHRRRSRIQSDLSTSCGLRASTATRLLSCRLVDAVGTAIKQQAVDLHHRVNLLVQLGGFKPVSVRWALEDGVVTSIAV